MLKLEDGKIITVVWGKKRDKTVQQTLDKYFSGKFGEALLSAKNS